VGSRVGLYEVLGGIGAGGMGEVYRARDTKLNRDVALKVLPALFASDPDRLARFVSIRCSLGRPAIPNRVFEAC
jgi:serine/threonine protein kinase